MFDLDEKRPDFFDEREEQDVRGQEASPRPGDRIDFADGDAAASGTRRPRRWRRAVAWTLAVCAILLGAAVWLRYFNPYATDSVVDAYIVRVERRGIIFKTNEADIISEAALTDTGRLYSRDMSVTIPSDDVARELRSLQGTGRKASLVTERYWGMLPWRGGSTIVVTGLAPGRYHADSQESTEAKPDSAMLRRDAR